MSWFISVYPCYENLGIWCDSAKKSCHVGSVTHVILFAALVLVDEATIPCTPEGLSFHLTQFESTIQNSNLDLPLARLLIHVRYVLGQFVRLSKSYFVSFDPVCCPMAPTFRKSVSNYIRPIEVFRLRRWPSQLTSRWKTESSPKWFLQGCNGCSAEGFCPVNRPLPHPQTA